MPNQNPITVKDVLDKVEALSIPLLKDLIVKLILRVPVFSTGILGVIVTKIAIWLFDTFLIPLGEDLEMEAIALVKKKELSRKVYKYEQAQTNDEFDDTFDDLLGGSKL